jgi:hypothetical protein
MRGIRKKIRRVGKDLSSMKIFLDALPSEIREDVKRQLQTAFEAGCAYSELQNIPQHLPVDDAGIIRIGPALKYHIMETRKVYGDVENLREIVADIFDKKSQELLRDLVRGHEEKKSDTNATQFSL